VFWRAIKYKATLAVDGSLTIEGYTSNEKLTLITTATMAQNYPLGTSASNSATYVLTEATKIVTFATGTGIGEGQLVITDYDVVNKTVTGTFKFNAENIYDNPLAGSILNFQRGLFYKIPVVR
jgi:hypothetical protein